MRSLQVMAFEQLLVRNAVNGFVEYPRRLHGDRLVMGEGLCVGNAGTRGKRKHYKALCDVHKDVNLLVSHSN